MARLIFKVLLATVVLSGCQQTKMNGVKPAPATAVQAAPTRYYVPPQNYTPPQTYVPTQPVQVPVHYAEPPVVDVHEVAPLPATPVCTVNCGTQVIKPAPVPEDCAEGGACPPPPPVRENCAPIALNASVDQPKLDVLFVVDTSASLRGGSYKNKTGGELGQLARDSQYFMNRLDQRTDVRIGMLLGHGPGMTKTHGKLFGKIIDYVAIQAAIRKDYQSKKQKVSTDEVQKLAKEQVGKELEQRMISMPKESKGAQGEALLLSVYDAMTKPELLKGIKTAGLLRKDVPLAVIFITDEQDVCYDYAANKVTPRSVDPIETKFFNETCKTAVNGGPLQPGHVYDALKNVVGEKLIVTGIVYKDNNMPEGTQDENEEGHGIIDLVQLASGQIADLAQIDLNAPNFWAQLDQLGKFADFKMRFTNSFACRSNVNPAQVNPATLEVRVYDKSNHQVALFTGQCTTASCKDGALGNAQWQTMIDGKTQQPYGRAVVPAQALGDLLTSKGIDQGTVKMSFFQRQ